MSGPDTMAAPPPPATPDIQAGPPPVESGATTPSSEALKPSLSEPQQALLDRTNQSLETGDPTPPALVAELAAKAPPLPDIAAPLTENAVTPAAQTDAEQQQSSEAERQRQASIEEGNRAYAEVTDGIGLTIREDETVQSLLDRINKNVDSPWNGEDPTTQRYLQRAIDTAIAQREAAQPTVVGTEQQPAEETADSDAEAAEEPATAAEDGAEADAATTETPEQPDTLTIEQAQQMIQEAVRASTSEQGKKFSEELKTALLDQEGRLRKEFGGVLEKVVGKVEDMINEKDPAKRKLTAMELLKFIAAFTYNQLEEIVQESLAAQMQGGGGQGH